MSRSKPNRRSRGKGAVAPLPKSPQVRATAIQIHQQSAFSGPIPPPEFLREYETIMPGLADRIVKMAEKQGDHRQGLETRAVNAEIERGRLGMISGFFVALLGLSIGGVLIYHDKLLGQHLCWRNSGSACGHFRIRNIPAEERETRKG